MYSDGFSVFSSVRISTIPAFGTIMETVTQKEVQVFHITNTPHIFVIFKVFKSLYYQKIDIFGYCYIIFYGYRVPTRFGKVWNLI